VVTGRESRRVTALIAIAVAASTVALVMPLSASGGLTAVLTLYEHDGIKIPNGHGAATMTFKAPSNSRTVSSVLARFRVRHEQTRQLKLRVENPAGEKVLVSDGETHGPNLGSGRCGKSPSGVVFTGFADGASQELGDSSAPYPGDFKPHQALAPLTGDHPGGKWTLIVKDTKRGGDPGRFLCGEVRLALPPP
jgi:hypothetical protein